MCNSAQRLTLLGLGLALGLILLPAASSAGGHREHDRQEAGSGHGSHTTHWGPRSAAWEHARAWHAGQHRCDVLAEHVGEHGAHPEVLDFLERLFRCNVPAPSSLPQAPPPLATLVDGSGTPFADLGLVEVDDSVIEVPARSSFVNPVVILGPATHHEADPGVVQLESVQADRFQVRFREWPYLDGVHGAEAVSYLILAPGRHRLADGSEWEVGSLDLAEAGTFFSQAFTSPFAAPPELFLTLQTPSDEAPVVVRARDVTASGFQAAMMEEEAADGVHGPERVGYLAISSPPGSGALASTSSALPYLVTQVVAGSLPVPALSGSVWMEEETSADPEVDHSDETLAYLAIGPEVFAQAMTYAGVDPATVRRTMPEQAAAMEWGTIPQIDDQWHTIPLARKYTDPVVVVGPVSLNGGDPGELRVRNVRGDAFEMRFQEWPYLNGVHHPERAFYMVAERGVQAVGGLTLEAGTLDSSSLLNTGAEDDVAFTFPFGDVPGVFASVNTENDPTAVTVRVSDRTPTGFRMAMQEEEASSGPHGVERLGWIAIQRGEGTTSDGRLIRAFDTPVQMDTFVSLGGGLSGRFPVLLGHIVSTFGIDPITLRFRNLGANGVDLVEQEEQSADLEVSHTAEDVSVFVGE